MNHFDALLDRLEWAGESLRTLFAQKKNIFSPSFLKMVYEILKFGDEGETTLISDRMTFLLAPLLLGKPELHHVTMRQYLSAYKYSKEFQESMFKIDHLTLKDYILPITAAIWSTPASEMLEFPAIILIQFMHNHKMLQMDDRPRWRTGIHNLSVIF